MEYEQTVSAIVVGWLVSLQKILHTKNTYTDIKTEHCTGIIQGVDHLV